MSMSNETPRTKRTAAVKRSRVSLSADDRLRLQAHKVVTDVQEMGGIATAAAQEKLETLRDDASEYYEEGRAKAHDVQHSVERFIQEQPVKAVLIAAGVGLLFGRFWMRR